jgi:hypothetical protein
MTIRKELTTEERKEFFLTILSMALNNVTKTCEITQVSRATYYKWLDQDQDFADQVRAIMDQVIDYVESKQLALIEALDGPQIRFFLQHQAKRRGYGKETKQIHEYPDGLPPPNQHLHLHMPPIPKNLADWEDQVRTLRANRPEPVKLLPETSDQAATEAAIEAETSDQDQATEDQATSAGSD